MYVFPIRTKSGAQTGLHSVKTCSYLSFLENDTKIANTLDKLRKILKKLY